MLACSSNRARSSISTVTSFRSPPRRPGTPPAWRWKPGVDGDLDGEHLRVARRLLHQLEEGLHALVGVEEQRVPPEDLGDELLPFHQPRRPLGRIGRVAQGGGALRGELALQGIYIAHGQGRLGAEHLLARQLQPLAQILLPAPGRRPPGSPGAPGPAWSAFSAPSACGPGNPPPRRSPRPRG